MDEAFSPGASAAARLASDCQASGARPDAVLRTRLARNHFINCHTCHSLATDGADNVPASIGHGWQKGPRNSPTVLNAVFNAAQFWDGRAADLAEQAKGPVEAMVEMNNTPERVIATLGSIPEYVDHLKRAFPNATKPLSYDTVARAIEAFESTLQRPTRASINIWPVMTKQ